ncbi:uncharacterized protein [Branchiostoma lanceolatum]|uniref:uncharacterized protein isoform X1 n=1 Tax=Branchiostoma lanceolatum TaxID=7740 RepID=UPI0034513A91
MTQQTKKALYLANDFDSLHKLADVEFKAGGWILKHAETAKKLFAAAEAAGQVGDEEKAFVYYMRYLNLLNKVCCTQEYRKKKEQQPELVVPLFSMRSPAGMKAIQEAERLKQSLKLRYEQLARTRAQQRHHQYQREVHESCPTPPPYTLVQDPPPPYTAVQPTALIPSAPPLEQLAARQGQQMTQPAHRPVPPMNYTQQQQPHPPAPSRPAPPAPSVSYPGSQPPTVPGVSGTGVTPVPQTCPAYPSDNQTPTVPGVTGLDVTPAPQTYPAYPSDNYPPTVPGVTGMGVTPVTQTYPAYPSENQPPAAQDPGTQPHVPLYPTLGDTSAGNTEPSPGDGTTQGDSQPTTVSSDSSAPHEVPGDERRDAGDESGRTSPDLSDFVVYGEGGTTEDRDSTGLEDVQQPEVPTLENRGVTEDASGNVPDGEEDRDAGNPQETPTPSGQKDDASDERMVLPPSDEYAAAGGSAEGGEGVRKTGQDGGMDELTDGMASLHLQDVPSTDLDTPEDVPRPPEDPEPAMPTDSTQDTGNVAGESTLWPCVQCTYLNEEWRHHCEMCYNSRNTSFIGNPPGFETTLHNVALQPESEPEREAVGPVSDQSSEDSGEEYNSAPEDSIPDEAADLLISDGDRITWVCHRCTYVNTGVSPICVMCRVLRRVDYPVPDEAVEDISSRFGRLTRPPLRRQEAGSSASGGTALLDSLRQQLAMNQGYHKHSVTVSRESIHADVIRLYSDTDRRTWTHQIRVTFKGEPSVDVKGVSREMFTIFWESVKQKSTAGSDVQLPISTPEYNQRYWEAVGRALCHCYVLVGHYPVDVIPEVITLHILDKRPTKPALQEAFLNTLTETERTLLKSLFDNYTPENFTSKKTELRDFLINCEIQTMPTFQDFPEIFHRVAEFKVFEEPKAAILGIVSGFGEASAEVFKQVTTEDIHALYSSLQPTANNIIGKLELTTQSRRGEGPRVFSMLTSFLYNSNEDVCRKFLRYVTGSNLLSMEAIKVRVDPGVRGIESHTCFNEIALPTFQECSSQEEFNQVWMTLLEDSAAWEYNLT